MQIFSLANLTRAVLCIMTSKTALTVRCCDAGEGADVLRRTKR